MADKITSIAELEKRKCQTTDKFGNKLIYIHYADFLELKASVREDLKEIERLESTNINASVELALGAQKAELRRILGGEGERR